MSIILFEPDGQAAGQCQAAPQFSPNATAHPMRPAFPRPAPRLGFLRDLPGCLAPVGHVEAGFRNCRLRRALDCRRATEDGIPTSFGHEALCLRAKSLVGGRCTVPCCSLGLVLPGERVAKLLETVHRPRCPSREGLGLMRSGGQDQEVLTPCQSFLGA